MDRNFTQSNSIVRLIGGFMNFRKLLTYLAVGTAAVIPFAGAQNPTILQGNYISNVFGQSNFILNPNAQTNVANVTVSSATVTRSTTTPLVATTEFNITTSTATGYADWATRTFDAGMKNQNCEARFTYRGFSVGSTTVQIRQGSNTVAQLTLTASTDPRIASINFPCGDLSAATTLRVQQATAALTGTNELSGLYLGLATNQANVAQAELVGSITFGTDCYWSTTSSTYNSPSDASCTTTVTGNVAAVAGIKPGIAINDTRPGNYQIFVQGGSWARVGVATYQFCSARLDDGRNLNIGGYVDAPQTSTTNQILYMGAMFPYTTTGTKQIDLKMASSDNVTGCGLNTSVNALQFTVYRFPTSSELVVTPERQNTWGGVVYTSGNQTLRSGQAASSTYYEFNNAAWNQPTLLKGKAQVSTTNSGNDLGFSIPNLPVGNYLLNITGVIASEVNSTTSNAVTECSFRIYETTTATTIGRQLMRDAYVPSVDIRDYLGAVNGVFTNTSVGTRNFRLEAAKATDNSPGTTGQCQAYASTNTTSISFTITPLDQPSNSALYVQGPVKAAATGDAVASGYQMEGINNVGNSATNQSNGVWRTGTGLTLQPGVYFIDIYNQVANIAPTAMSCGITKTVNGAPINDDRNRITEIPITEQNNTTQAKVCVSYGYFRVTTTTTFYSTLFVANPVSSIYTFYWNMAAIRLN